VTVGVSKRCLVCILLALCFLGNPFSWRVLAGFSGRITELNSAAHGWFGMNFLIVTLRVQRAHIVDDKDFGHFRPILDVELSVLRMGDFIRLVCI